MRTRITILTGALLVTSAVFAQAQETKPTTTQPPAAAALPSLGTVDFGYRGTSFTGDEARYNRYRDLRDGGYVDRFRFGKESETTAFRLEANNVGYRDQRYFADLQSIGKLKANFVFNSNPLYQGQNLRGYFTGMGTGTLTINDAAQQAIQTSALNAEAALGQYGQTYAIKSRRDVANFNMAYTATRDVDLKVQVRNTNRTGTNLQDFGFGSSPGNMMVLDMAVPVEDRTTDVKTKLEYANQKGLLSVGYDASWYNQHNPAFTFDNPQRASDSATAGPAFGRAALMPTNTFNTFNANGSYKLAHHSRATAAFSYGVMDQNESLLPNTTNTALAAAALPRSTADAKVDVMSTLLGFSSRPTPELLFNAKFRYYDWKNKTEQFTNQVIPGDYTLGAIETSEPTAFDRKSFDLDGSYSPMAFVDFGVGYTFDGYANHVANEKGVQARIYESTGENTFRLTADSTGNQFVTARFKYEHSKRTASNFDEDLLVEIGEQVGMRHYDIAPRDRDRVTGIFTVTPTAIFDVNASVSYGHDKYPDSAPIDALNPTGVTFGLRDNKNTGFTVGFDVVPNAVVNFGLNYGREKYDTFQYSRTSNPLSATDVTFLDPRRDWSDTINDKVNTFSANLNLVKAIEKTDIRLSYDLSDGATNYTYGLVPNTTIAAPVQYSTQPTNRIEVFKLDGNYYIRPNVALGAAYWYEHYKVQDFALDPAIINANIVRNPANNALTGFYSGYAFEPYTANTFFVRMRYLW